MISKLIKEDDEYWYFESGVKKRKSIGWTWHKRCNPSKINNDQSADKWQYSDYSQWARELAQLKTIEELKDVVNECEYLSEVYAMQHLKSIEATTSMQSQSQRRAHARNNVVSNYEKKKAHLDAIEIKKLFPDKCSNVSK